MCPLQRLITTNQLTLFILTIILYDQYRGLEAFLLKVTVTLLQTAITEVCPMVLRSGVKYLPTDTVSQPRKL